MDCLIISGMSGGGKSLATDVLEDIGYYCVDNMPAKLIPRFFEMFSSSSAKYKRVAFVVDVRGDNDYQFLFQTLEEMRTLSVNSSVLFLDCRDAALINRHKESRRRHPLDVDGKGLVAAVAEERLCMEPVKLRADYLIDTTSLTPGGLKNQLLSLFGGGDKKSTMVISIGTFGFKYGIPHESDMVFDVRFIKNPYYVAELRELTGKDKEVYDYVFQSEAAQAFTEKLIDLIDFLIPQYIAEGRMSFVISIGCTGGRHRSVAMGERLFAELEKAGHNVIIRHRDSERR